MKKTNNANVAPAALLIFPHTRAPTEFLIRRMTDLEIVRQFRGGAMASKLRSRGGMDRHFAALELARIRRLQVRKSFGRHLLFYWDRDTLRIEHVMHGGRDLPRRPLEEPDEP